jgi:hypothetical protein
MLDVLEWVKKRIDETAGPRSARPTGADSLPNMLSADPATALAELRVRLRAEGDAPGSAGARSAAHARIQDTGAPHVAALLSQYLIDAAGTHAAREAAWKSLIGYQLRLAQALCASAGAALTAASAARALSACRVLAKLHLVHYATVPGKLWQVAYSIHASAEKAGFTATPVHVQPDQRSTTTVEQELLRLLMLCVGAPDMLAPEQIEVADRIVEQLGAEFTLRQPGIADNPFCFEPGSEYAPRRAQGRQAAAGTRYFGPGMGYASLERFAKQAGAGRLEDFKAFGKDIASRVQLGTAQHLLTFWRADCPYAPPAHAPASGSFRVVHGYGRIWQYVSDVHHGAGELSLADSPRSAPQPPETWELKGAGGNELGAEVPQESRGWVKCGGVVGLSLRDGERWVGMIRRMHARPDGGLQADVVLLSREPREVSLRAVIAKYDDSVFTDASSRQFAGHTLQAIILSDGAEGTQPPNLLLPPEEWQEGRVYEVQSKEGERFLRGLQVVRRWDDYVRATFEWLAVPD